MSKLDIFEKVSQLFEKALVCASRPTAAPQTASSNSSLDATRITQTKRQRSLFWHKSVYYWQKITIKIHPNASKIHFSAYMEQLNANISSTLGAIMFGLQRAQNRRISYAEMAEEIGVSQRAFAEWMRGARAPAAMEALLRMLSMLPEDDVLRVLESWRNQEITQHVPNRPNSKSAPKKITRTTSKQ